MRQRLQPCATEAATVRDCQRLQPCVTEAAALCAQGRRRLDSSSSERAAPRSAAEEPCQPCLRLQPLPRTVAASAADGCSLCRIRLQPLPHTVAASAAYGCRLGVGASWAFSDCVGLEEEALRSVPQPCVGCIFLYPFRQVVRSSRGSRCTSLASSVACILLRPSRRVHVSGAGVHTTPPPHPISGRWRRGGARSACGAAARWKGSTLTRTLNLSLSLSLSLSLTLTLTLTPTLTLTLFRWKGCGTCGRWWETLAAPSPSYT